MRGAETLALNERRRIRTQTFCLLGDSPVVRPNDHGKRGASALWGSPQHMRQQRLAGDGMQDLRHRGLHARALTGGEHDREAGSAGHSNPWSLRQRLRRRHKVFLPEPPHRWKLVSSRLRMQARFLLMFGVLIRRRPQEGRERPMAKDSDHLAGGFEIENTGGFLSGLLAEEDQFDRRSLWRLGSWGVSSVGAVILALLANQSSIGLRREQMAAADQARPAQQNQSVAKESQSEARRLASAIDTLNGDREPLYARVNG